MSIFWTVVAAIGFVLLVISVGLYLLGKVRRRTNARFYADMRHQAAVNKARRKAGQW